MTKPTEQRNKHLQLKLWRYCVATASMERVIAICEHLTQLQLPSEGAVYQGLIAGAVLEYCRPFCAGPRSSIGNVEGRFGNFPDADMKETHEMLIDARKNLYGHYSVGRQEIMVEVRQGTEPQELHFNFGRMDEGFMHTGVPSIMKVARFQLARFQEGRNELLKSQRAYPLGVFRLAPHGTFLTSVPQRLENGWHPLR